MILALATAVSVPFGCLALLLWLARLEETLTRDVRRGQRLPEPPPIRAIRVASPARAVSVEAPAPAAESSREASPVAAAS